MEQCRDVYATRQRAAAEEPAPALPLSPPPGKGPRGGAPGGKDWSAFRIALMAAKRRAKPPSGRI